MSATDRVLRACALVGAALLAVPPATGAAEEKPSVTVLKVLPHGSDVFLGFQLTGVLNPEIARKIEAGLETTIRYEIRLYRQYRWWFDNFLDSRHYDISVTFDPVTREYVVVDTLDDKTLSRTTTTNFEDVQKLLFARDNLLAFHVGPDWPHRNLVVQMRAAFDSGYLFAFIPVDYRTRWKKSPRFTIGGPEGGGP